MDTKQEVTHRVKKQYQEYVIEVLAVAVRTGGFTAHFTIMKDGRSYVDVTPIHSGKVFATENEALEGGLALGRQMIDGGLQPKKIVVNQ
jgi:hypothetical protein